MFCSSFEILLSFFDLINGGQGKHPELELRSTFQMRKYLFIVCLFFCLSKHLKQSVYLLFYICGLY